MAEVFPHLLTEFQGENKLDFVSGDKIVLTIWILPYLPNIAKETEAFSLAAVSPISSGSLSVPSGDHIKSGELS